MASVNLVGTNGYSTGYYLRKFYGQNKNYIDSAGRAGVTYDRLSAADSKALRRALEEIEKDLKNEGENAEVEVSAFVEAYNNLMESASDTDNKEINKLKKQVQKLTTSAKKELEAIGVSVSGSGKLKIDKEVLKEASDKKISRVFAEDAEFGRKMKAYRKKMERLTTDNSAKIASKLAEKKANERKQSVDLYL